MRFLNTKKLMRFLNTKKHTCDFERIKFVKEKEPHECQICLPPSFFFFFTSYFFAGFLPNLTKNQKSYLVHISNFWPWFHRYQIFQNPWGCQNDNFQKVLIWTVPLRIFLYLILKISVPKQHNFCMFVS